MDIKTIKKVHCVGIGGIGVSALARYFHMRGVVVSGSNIVDENLDSLRNLGINIFIGHKKENLTDGLDLIIYSSAIIDDNQELTEARKRGIKTIDYAEALGLVIGDYYGIAISGTNGKTTTTALLGTTLSKTKIDPTIILGGNVVDWGGNFHAGKGDVFLVEGCEYKKNMLKLKPRAIVLTNIEEDHLDFYKDLEEIKHTFSEYVCGLDKKGVLVFNADDKNVVESSLNSLALKISYGLTAESDLYADNIVLKDGIQKFDMVWKKENIGRFETRLPGIFNIYNILASSAMALHLGIDKEVIHDAIAVFGGVDRRFETFKSVDGKIIISDYAHHPTSVKEIIQATKKMYVGKKVLAVFQPHQKDRTVKLFDEFVRAFDEADEVILSEVYDVAGRESAQKISSNDMAEAIKKRNSSLVVSFAKNITETKRLVQEKKHDFDVVLVMGAGDIYKVVNSLIQT